MTHLDDGTIQAFLDDELPAPDRARVAEHLLACERCSGVQGELTRANARVREALSLLDVTPPAARAPAGAGRSRGRRTAGSLVKAAGLVLGLAAAASAAVPGSPVREWIESMVEPAPVAETPAPDAEPAAPVAQPAAPAAVSLPAGDRTVVVALAELDGVAIRLRTDPSDQATILVRGAQRDPVFRTGADRLEARGAAGGELVVELPGGSDARLEVDGRIYAERTGGMLQVRVPADTVDGAVVWP